MSHGQPRARQDHKPYNAKLATSKPRPNTSAVLKAWREGVPTETIAKEFGLTEVAIRARASWHRAKRPDWYLSQMRREVKVASLG
jgi:hypothetical protein